GRLVAAAEEERFNRVKYAAGFPARAVRYCLEEAGISIAEVDRIAVPRDPWARLASKALYALRLPRFALDRSKALVRFAGIREELARACEVATARITAGLQRVAHHRTHLASAIRVSRFAADRWKALVRFAGIAEDLARACEVAPARITAGLHRVEHHRAHLASSFFVSPFEEAAVLSADGLGDFASTMWAAGHGNRLEV